MQAHYKNNNVKEQHCCHSKGASTHEDQASGNHIVGHESQSSAHCCNIDAAHNEHHSAMVNSLLKRFCIALVITVPILILSPMIQSIVGFHLALPGSIYISFLLSTIIYFFGGKPFLKGLYEEFKNKRLGMMTLIGIAISVAYVYSSAVTFGLAGGDFYFELAVLIDIMLLGHWLEMKSVLKASRSLELLVELLPQAAHLLVDNKLVEVKLDSIQINDIVLVKPGEKVPVDGKIVEGLSYLNESMLTGESKPVKREPGERVIGGSINGNGALKVQVEHTGKDSYLTKVFKLVREAQQMKSKTQGIADQAAKWLTFIAIGIGLLTFASWLGIGKDIAFALERMVTVLVISCPCALGLAVPLVVAISTTLSAQHGLLIRNRTAFENSRKITTIVFDKTGTLTQGNFKVVRYESLNQNYSKEEILRLAASLEQHSEHPIALGIVNLAKEKNLNLEAIENFQALTGQGVTAKVNGNSVKIVSPNYLVENKINFTDKYLENAAETVVFVLVNDEVKGYLALADEIREESFSAIKILKENHIRTVMLTGDNQETAQVVSEAVGIDNFYSGILPHQKLEIIKELQKKGEFVAMVGDGVNDAPALAQADIGIAIGSGTDVAAETADIILVKSNPNDIAALIAFGNATYHKIIQNLVWATGYNIIAVPLAAGILYYSGITLSPAVGAALMSLSSVAVAFNAQLLKKQFTSF